MKITKKMREEEKQRNVILAKEYYSDSSISELLNYNVIFDIGKVLGEVPLERQYRISLDDIKKIDVEYDDCKMLVNVAYLTDDAIIYDKNGIIEFYKLYIRL